MKFQIKKDGLTGETLKFAEVMESALAAAFEDATKGTMTEKEVDTLIAKAMEGKGLSEEQEKSIRETAEAVRKQAAEIDKLKAGGIQTDEESLQKTLENAKDELKAIQKARTGIKEFALKVPAVTMTTNTITNSIGATAATRLGGTAPVNEITRPRPFILDFVSLGSTNLSVLIWFDEAPKEGDFAVTAEGALKPMVEYKFVRRSADYKKAAGYTALTDEFDRDFPGLVTIIKRLMQTDCRNKVADIILTDLLAAAPVFSYTGLNGSIDNADNYAAIGAAVAQTQGLFFEPNVLFINPADSWKMKLTKNTQGDYVMPPFEWNGSSYAFGTVIVDPRIAAGTFLLGDLSMFNVDMYGDIIVKIGYVNDDLIKNQYTVVVEQFFYDYIKTSQLGALVKGNFNTIKAALEAA